MLGGSIAARGLTPGGRAPPNAAMLCIVYLSSAATPMEDEDLGEILRTSRLRNPPADVTGVLCHYEGSFLQFLEGPRAAVSATYERIARDPRHHNLLRVYEGLIETRAFGDWSMAMVKPGALSPADQPFCRRLEEVRLDLQAGHARKVDGFLQAFRSWLR